MNYPSDQTGYRSKAVDMDEPGSERSDPRRKERGFTLLELLVVLAILALIAAFAGPRVFNLLSGARSNAAKVQIENLATTLDLYRLETGHYPSEDEGLSALVERPAGTEIWNGPYLTKADGLIDPWGNPYRYRMPPENAQDYDLYTLGADNTEGGDAEDRDIGNW